MNSRLIFPVRVLISYFLLFNFFRLIFVIAALSRQPELDILLTLESFVHGISLDLSASSYFATIPALMWSVSLFSEKSSILRVASAIHGFLTGLCVIILCGNLAIYAAWGTMLDYRALSFVTEPKGIIASLSNFQLILISVLLPLLVFIITKLSRKYVNQHAECKKAYRYVAALIVLFGLFVLIRGGLQTVPINNSRAWYCNVQALNDAAANPAWYLFDNINRNLFQSSKRYKFMDDGLAKKRFSELNTKSLRTGSAKFNVPKPNVVLVVLESWSADLSAQLTQEEGSVRTFDSLCASGLLFDSLYASGRRTDHMFPSILCGIPSIPERSLVRYNDKCARLTMISDVLKKNGYSTTFHYGGDLGFSNMNSFLRRAGFEEIIGEPDFEQGLRRGKWGVADGDVFNKLQKDLDAIPQPFFSMTLTLSSHEPFDVPAPYDQGKGEAERFRNAAKYTDHELGRFLRAASKKAWFDNTIFVFVADHGHILPKRRDYYDQACHRIPMLWWGPALPESLKGKRSHTAGGQHDLVVTLLNRLAIPLQENPFPFSGDLLNAETSPRPVYLNYETGFGWRDTRGSFVYLFSQERYLNEYTSSSASDSSMFVDGKAYLQILEAYFNSL